MTRVTRALSTRAVAWAASVATFEAETPSDDVIVEEVVVDGEPADLLAVTPEVEAQLTVEEEIERRTAQDHTDTPHFRKDAE